MTDTSSIIAGNRLALSRLLTQIENDTTQGRAALNELFPHTGKAHLIGVTGAPGTGKSSLVNRLAYFYRHPPQGQEARRVAVVAVDPSSPFSGGAVLGDRVRMKDLAGDPGVFIRSMASRGSLGGLATATAGIVQAFDAAGFEVILIETVGAGQAEVDIARLAHTTLVVEAPGLGDDIQAIKAGILEIADILVINKADRPGVENTER
ncbi:MAG: methylmalonyl Co-A mutase-associated GTPase MeaB, partial [Anaerolineales bacterium]